MTSVPRHNSPGESPKLSAIILAAGYSSRMGEFKPLLPIGDRRAIEWVVHLFASAGVQDVCVILGHRAQELRPFAEAAGARCVFNAAFEQGMYSSVCTGVDSLPLETEACFMMPADTPLVRPGTIRRLAQQFVAERAAVVYPMFEERRGHPPLISRSVLIRGVGDGNVDRLSSLLAAHERSSRDVFVPDEAIHLDMDTTEDLARVRELALRRDLPTRRECESLLMEYQREKSVQRHSRVVADVALSIATALVNAQVSIDPLLTRAGALLHDVAKGQDAHAEAGADLLRDFGLDAVAEVVACHTDLPPETGLLSEASIVYLADKLVSGDQIVGVSRRFDRAIERFRDNPMALAAALRRRGAAEAIVARIEQSLGRKLREIVAEGVSEGRVH